MNLEDFIDFDLSSPEFQNTPNPNRVYLRCRSCGRIFTRIGKESLSCESVSCTQRVYGKTVIRMLGVIIGYGTPSMEELLSWIEMDKAKQLLDSMFKLDERIRHTLSLPILLSLSTQMNNLCSKWRNGLLPYLLPD